MKALLILSFVLATAGAHAATTPPGCRAFGADRLLCKAPIAPTCTKTVGGLFIGWLCPAQ